MKIRLSGLKVAAITALLSCGLVQQAHAAGFAIIEHSASGMGNAFAGAAAVAEDASTIWFNPAGMTHVGKRQLTLAGHVILPSAEYTDQGSSINPQFTGGATVPGSLTGPNDETDETAFVPNFYYIHPINQDAYFGLGINAPFGLVTEYEDDWVGRYQAIKSDLMTVNVNPSFAWKMGSKLSLGFGFNFQYVDVELSRKIDSGATCFGLANQVDPALAAQCVASGLAPSQQALDSDVVIEGDDWSYGFNLGMLYEINSGTRTGFSYRSAIEHGLSGDADFTVNPALQSFINSLPGPFPLFLSDSAVHAGVELPAQASFSLAHAINSKVELLADATWTDWSSFDELRIDFLNAAQPDSVTPEEWKDSWRFSFGANIRVNPKWIIRTGFARDQTPIPNAMLRTPRIPGNDRMWLSLGAGVDVTPAIHLDVGYSHLFIEDTPIDHTDSTGYTLRGEYEADVNILSAQLNWNF